MRKILIVLMIIPLLSKSQNNLDSLNIVSDNLNFLMPIRDGNNVTYEFISTLDSNYTENIIYENTKAALSILSKNSGVGVNTYQIFKVYGSEPLLFEDKASNRMIFQLNFRTLRKEGEPEDIVNDLLYFLKADIRIKGNRIKFTFKDIDLYFQSKGAAFLVGAQNSLFKINFNGFLGSMVGVTTDGNGDNPKIIDGILERSKYDAKRIYTVDYKLRNVIVPYLISEINKNIRDSKF